MVKQNKQSVTLSKASLPIIASSKTLDEIDLRVLIYLFGFLDSNELNAKPIDMSSMASCIKSFSKKELKKSKKHLIEKGILKEVPSNYSEKSYILDIQYSDIFKGNISSLVDDWDF